jgi:hypothetical protein
MIIKLLRNDLKPVVIVYATRCNINLLKTKLTCFIYGLSAYRAVNTLHFGYKNQSLNVFIRQKLLFLLRSVQNT